MTRPDRGSFEELLESRGERTVPNVIRLKSRQIGFTETMHRMDRRRKWRLAFPSLLILAGCGCFLFSLWPDTLGIVGCGLFVVATVINLVRCVR